MSITKIFPISIFYFTILCNYRCLIIFDGKSNCCFFSIVGNKILIQLNFQKKNKYKIYETKMTDCVFAIEMKLDKMRGD